MVETRGLTKAEVLAALYNAARPQGMGFLQFVPGDMRIQEAEDLVKVSDYFDYLKGRVMKVDLSNPTEFDERLYDRDNGRGAAQKAISTALKKKVSGVTPKFFVDGLLAGPPPAVYSVPLENGLEHMLISAVRYAIGRRTYMVDLTVCYMLPLLPRLTDWCINIMLRDVAEEFSLAESLGDYHKLGDECDIQDWKKFRAALEHETEIRKERALASRTVVHEIVEEGEIAHEKPRKQP